MRVLKKLSIGEEVSDFFARSNRYLCTGLPSSEHATQYQFFLSSAGKVTLNSWQEIIKLNFVRHCLQGGFQIQLMTNETLQAIFGAVFDGSGMPLNQLEKRMYMSKTSEAAKAADRAMTKQRRNRTNVKNHFLTADGEDI